jgi:hypothetical protein
MSKNRTTVAYYLTNLRSASTTYTEYINLDYSIAKIFSLHLVSFTTKLFQLWLP